MAGPYQDVIASLRKGSNRENICGRISGLVAACGLGIWFGVETIRRHYRDEGNMLDELSSGVENTLVFTINSDPDSTYAFDLFEQTLNLLRADSAKAPILRLFREVWQIEEIQAALFIILESIDSSAKYIPRHKMRFEEFLGWLATYHEMQLRHSGHGGGQGLFKVAK